MKTCEQNCCVTFRILIPENNGWNWPSQESDSSNSSPLSSTNASSSPAVTGSPTSLDNNRPPSTSDNTDGRQTPNGDCHTNGRRHYNHTKAPIIEENGNEIDESSYMALDQLLASLALENDIMERHLSQINNNDTNSMKSKQTNHQTNGIFSFETNTRDNHYVSNGNYRMPKSNGYDENLNDVLANLIEFSENESLPQTPAPTNSHQMNAYGNGMAVTNGINHHNPHYHSPYPHQPTHFNHFNNNFNNNNHINSNFVTTNGNGNHINNNHINRVHNYHEPSNNAIKRLTSESENSSSVSPSLSERSNGIVSWSDQVCCPQNGSSTTFIFLSLSLPLFCFFFGSLFCVWVDEVVPFWWWWPRNIINQPFPCGLHNLVQLVNKFHNLFLFLFISTTFRHPTFIILHLDTQILMYRRTNCQLEF